MEVAVSPRLFGDIGVNKVTVQHPTGSVTFAGWRRIVEGMKKGGEMPADWNVIGVNIEPNGIAFIFGPKL